MRFFCSCWFTVFICIFQVEHVQAKKKITWPYVCYEPVYICEGKELVGGFGYQIVKMLWAKMDDYEHELERTPIKRILSAAQKGHKQVFYGLYKTPKRDEFLHYSLPCRISIPTFLVVRAGDQEAFGNQSAASLKELLDEKKLQFLLFKSVSFGKEIDDILGARENYPNVSTGYDTTDMGPNALKMLTSKRIDFFLSLDSTQRDARSMGVSDQIAYVPIEEQYTYEIGYITAPKNSWGEQIIQKINTILREEIPKDDFFNLFKPLIDESQLEDFRRSFDKLIVQPVQDKN